MTKHQGIGATAMAALREGLTNEEVLEKVLEDHPGASTSLASINWYRSKLRRDGEDVKTQRELKKCRQR